LATVREQAIRGETIACDLQELQCVQPTFHGQRLTTTTVPAHIPTKTPFAASERQRRRSSVAGARARACVLHSGRRRRRSSVSAAYIYVSAATTKDRRRRTSSLSTVGMHDAGCAPATTTASTATVWGGVRSKPARGGSKRNLMSATKVQNWLRLNRRQRKLAVGTTIVLPVPAPVEPAPDGSSNQYFLASAASSNQYFLASAASSNQYFLASAAGECEC
jgi:hypothetical protein